MKDAVRENVGKKRGLAKMAEIMSKEFAPGDARPYTLAMDIRISRQERVWHGLVVFRYDFAKVYYLTDRGRVQFREFVAALILRELLLAHMKYGWLISSRGSDLRSVCRRGKVPATGAVCCDEVEWCFGASLEVTVRLSEVNKFTDMIANTETE